MAVIGNAGLALRRLPPGAPARTSVEEIVKAGERAAELCGQMLAYSGKGKFVVELIDLNEVVRESADLLERPASRDTIAAFELADDLLAIEADRAQMVQILLNLVTNASEAIGEGRGVITVSTGVMACDRAYLDETYLEESLPEGDYVYLEVADTGCGMNSEVRERIFEPFFSTKFAGRGLGMAATLGIVRGHEGAIKVWSEPGRGSRVRVLFPARDWPASCSEEGTPEDDGRSNAGLVLLVDDEEMVRNVGKTLLEEAGFEVLTAPGGHEALEIFRDRKGEIDCVILDLTMAPLNGEETCRELHRMREDVLVVLTSGYNDPDVTRRLAGQGVAGFIQKPYGLDSLERKLGEVLGRGRALPRATDDASP